MADPVVATAKLAADRMRSERERAIADSVSELYRMLHLVRSLHQRNERYRLQLELPSERQITDAINALAHIYQTERQGTHEQSRQDP